MGIYGGVGAIILAAGESRRMGEPKQLLRICGEALARISARKALKVGFERVAMILGHRAWEVIESIKDLEGLELVINERYAEGMSTSLIAGVRFLRGLRAYMVMLVDQPFVRIDTIRRIVEEYLRRSGSDREPLMIIPRYMGRRGNPVLLSSALEKDILGLSGDVGARVLIDIYGDRVLYIDVDDPGVAIDLDSLEDLKKAEEIYGDLCLHVSKDP